MTRAGSSGEGQNSRPPNVAGADALVQVAEGVWVLPDRDRIAHVPNVGIVLGDRGVLVVESGIGIANGERVLEIVRELAGERRLFVTATHFHPEHGYGVQAFVGSATIVYNESQRDELREKQRGFVDLFSTFGPHIAEALRGVDYVPPDVTYAVRAEIDLGGRVVELHDYGPAHTRGDQVVIVPGDCVVFTGDLVEERFFAIFPDSDSRANEWIERLERLEALAPAVVVPGHGALGDAGLIATAKQSLVLTRDRVSQLDGEGRSIQEIVSIVEPELLARYPDWDNREWVGEIVRFFYAELPR